MSSSKLIFPINICLCAEEQAAVRLMIRITAACRPATPAACCEPNSLRGLRSVTHAPPHTLLHSPTCISHHCAVGGTLSSNDRCLAPPSLFSSSVTLLSRSWTPPSLRRFFKRRTASPCAPHSSDAYSHSPRPPPLPSVIGRRRRGGMSHLQPRWKRTLAVTTSSSSSSSVTV